MVAQACMDKIRTRLVALESRQQQLLGAVVASNHSHKRRTMSYTGKGLASPVHNAFATNQPSASSNFAARTAPASRQPLSSPDFAAHSAPAA